MLQLDTRPAILFAEAWCGSCTTSSRIVAYVAPVDEYVNSAYFELAGSAVQIMGPFQREELDELVSQLAAL